MAESIQASVGELVHTVSQVITSSETCLKQSAFKQLFLSSRTTKPKAEIWSNSVRVTSRSRHNSSNNLSNMDHLRVTNVKLKSRLKEKKAPL